MRRLKTYAPAAGVFVLAFIYALAGKEELYGRLYTESLYTFRLTACAYTLYRLQLHYSSFSKTPPGEKFWPRCAGRSLLQHRRSLLCGLLAGLAALARPNGEF